MASLRRRGEHEGAGRELGSCVRVGAAASCDWVLDEPGVAALHCELLRLPDGRFQLSRQSSLQATLVNGAPIERAVLRDGDIVSVGATEFVFAQPPGEILNDRDIDFDDLSARVSLRQDAAAPRSPVAPGAGSESPSESDLAKLRAAYDLARTIGLHQSLNHALRAIRAVAVFRASRGSRPVQGRGGRVRAGPTKEREASGRAESAGSRRRGAHAGAGRPPL